MLLLARAQSVLYFSEMKVIGVSECWFESYWIQFGLSELAHFKAPYLYLFAS